jgi:amidohydrolase
MPVHNRIADFAEEMTAWRRDIHQHPELGLEEYRTGDLVATKLAEWGIEVTRIAGTGVVGTLRQGNAERAIAIRADMDALPMPEETGLPYASENAGVMHACGHDGHATMLLGAARYLAETRNFDGTIHFFFQPAEEGRGGARKMIEEGLFERFPVSMVFGAHNDTHMKVGEMLVMAGALNAATARVTINITGRGGHAARPHHAIDPIVVGAQMVMALQTLISRRIDPIDSALISITQFHAGSAGNVIPETAMLNGTVRTLKAETQDRIEELMRPIVEQIAAANGAAAELEYRRGSPPVINAPEPTERAAIAAARVLGDGKVIRQRAPGLGGEDFALMAQKAPACFVRIGQAGAEAGSVPVHHPRYDFNDEILPIGASFWATLVEQELKRE